MQKLSAFHGKEHEKEICLNQVHFWLQDKMKPKTPEEIAHEIFNPVRTFKTSEFLLENFPSFPENLGLPLWISNLLRTINHHNSTEFERFDSDYRVFFYPRFVSACKVGIDYSLMFHEWEIMLLKKFIPKQEREKKHFLDLIALHEKALKGIPVDKKEWEKLSSELDVLCKNIDELTEKSEGFGQKEIVWNSIRAALLSTIDFINPDDVWTSSSEAVVNAVWEQSINSSENGDFGNEKVLRQKVWSEIMDKLIIMMGKWE